MVVRGTLRRVQAIREKSWMGEAEFTVKHTDGVNCQKEMRRIYGSLSHGATRVYMTYHCDDCDVSVSITLRAHPDIPYQLYRQGDGCPICGAKPGESHSCLDYEVTGG